MFMGFRAGLALVLAAAGVGGITLGSTVAEAGTLQCVPFAREVSGIDIHGNAGTWWSQAAGHYDRGHQPEVGAVLAMAPSHAMPIGHVAVVTKVVNEREILVSHANWSYRGGIERNVKVVDVSDAGDWSSVRVWYGPTGDLGSRDNPVQGFIYPEAPTASPTRLALAE